MGPSKCAALIIAAGFTASSSLRRHSRKSSADAVSEQAALAKGLGYISSGLDSASKAYLLGTAPSASTWRYGPSWADTFVGAMKGLPDTGVEVDDHDGTPIGNGESIGLVAARVTMDPTQISKMPAAFQTGLFDRCGGTCPTFPAALRVSHTNAANLDLQRISLKIGTSKYGEVDLHFTESLKGFPIGDKDQLNAFSFSIKHGMPLALARFPVEFAKMGLNANALVKEFGNASKIGGALGKNYYSMTPFLLGSAGPTAGAFKVRLVAQQSPKYLGGTGQEYFDRMRNQLVADVKAGTHKFSLEIQVATSGADHAINDAFTVWKETSAPWIRMGSVEIPKQSFPTSVNVGNAVGSGLWTKGEPTFNTKELAFMPGSSPNPPIGDISNFRSYLYPTYDKERQIYLLRKRSGLPAKCPFSAMS